MQILEATIHKLTKRPSGPGPGTVATQLAVQSLQIDDTLTKLCDKLVSLYSTSATSTGTLGADPHTHQFTGELARFTLGTTSFQNFTIEALTLIGSKMETEVLASGGYALFLSYTKNEENFLLIAMLKLTAGAAIDAGTLCLLPTLVIDLKQLHEAARINLTRQCSQTEPYLTFVKGTKKGDITKYFRDALACVSYLDTKHHTRELITAAQEFVLSRDDLISAEEKSDERIRMRARLAECMYANQVELSLTIASACIMPEAAGAFLEFLASDKGSGYQIDNSFKPHLATCHTLRRVTGKVGTVTVRRQRV